MIIIICRRLYSYYHRIYLPPYLIYLTFNPLIRIKNIVYELYRRASSRMFSFLYPTYGISSHRFHIYAEYMVKVLDLNLNCREVEYVANLDVLIDISFCKLPLHYVRYQSFMFVI